MEVETSRRQEGRDGKSDKGRQCEEKRREISAITMLIFQDEHNVKKPNKNA